MSLVNSSGVQEIKLKVNSNNGLRLTVRPSSVVLSQYNTFERMSSTAKEKRIKNLVAKQEFGYICDTAKKKIKDIVCLWVQSVIVNNKEVKREKTGTYRKLNFLTLTLSSTQIHDDKMIKRKILNNFLQSMRDMFGDFNYLWTAEKQKNGNIHFHMFTDVYIDKKVLRDKWNLAQESLGYVTAFCQKYNHINPPSTKIDTIHDVKKAESYITKYITKCDVEPVISGKAWGCSSVLNTLKPFSYLVSSSEFEQIFDFITHYNLKIANDEKFLYIQTGTRTKELLNSVGLVVNYNSYIKSLVDYLYKGVDMVVKCVDFCKRKIDNIIDTVKEKINTVQLMFEGFERFLIT